MKYGKILAAAVSATIAASIVLPAFAMEGSMSSSMMRKEPTKKTVDIVCVGKAVAKREAALGSAWTTSSGKISAAFTKRASDLAAAWAMTDAKARRTAIKAAWDAFQKSRKDARSGWNTAQKAAWTTFRTDVKACGTATASDASVQAEQAGSTIDAQ